MGGLREHDFESSLCAECGEKAPVGPCAACEAMICGDCGVLTKDPNGTKCICHSCARLIAEVGDRSQRKRKGAKKSTVVIAVALVAIFGLAAVGGLLW